MTFQGTLGGLAKALKWGLIVLVSICGLLLAINAVDEDPSPEMKSLRAIPQVKVDPANGYLALVGSNAPPGDDMFTYGTRWVEAFNTAVGSTAIKETQSRFPGDTLPFKGSDKQLCNPLKTSCLPKAKDHAEIWRKLAADNEVAITRQRRLTEFPRFEETYFPPNFESPIINYRHQSRLLVLDLIALDAAEGRLEPALAALEALIAFDRRTLQGSRILITGMVATNRLRQDYALLSEIVATRPAALAAQKPRLDRMTEPLETQQVRTIAGRLFEGEGRFMSNSLSKSLDLANNKQLGTIISMSFNLSADDNSTSFFSLLARPFLKSNATLNLIARNHGALQARIQEFSPENSNTWISQIRQDKKKQIDAADPFSLQILYNPVGKHIAPVSWVDFEDYVLRISDLMALTRLARLQVDVVTAGSTATDIPARIAANKAYYDPYTGKPMSWDADKRQLYFDARGNLAQGPAKRIQAGI